MKHSIYDDHNGEFCWTCCTTRKYLGRKCYQHTEKQMHAYIIEYTDGLGNMQFRRIAAESVADASKKFNAWAPGAREFSVYEKRNTVTVKITTELSYS